ncbi:Na+/H+ antiporter [Streptomyces marincola]|uniref:Na+/H+ antiporter n=1 Tax=Streptomyces marincola TaxID=2878388 RepID=UPI001CF2B817|nr:Na+/H+ antiporter [Streptomyces marincola]UCM88811.1 Na+/H+ antiporter [Streptomyces marincola]
MLGLVLVVVLGAAVLVCDLAGRHLHIATPVLLLVAGTLLGFLPGLSEVRLPPETMLLLFLPALLYWESLTTSPREIRRDLRGIVLMSTLLVLATAAAVATAAHALGLPWGPAWVLGAAVAPTDATAVGVLAGALPRRNITQLRAESLVNDGTALVVHGLAIGITIGQENLAPGHVTGLFLLAYAGGVAAGALTAWVAVRVRRHLDDPLQESAAIILIPFTAFLLAESAHASGVLAVVVCGLSMSQAGPRVGLPGTRRQTEEFWSLAIFLLNGSLFVLVGLEAQAAARNLTSDDLVHALAIVLVACATLAAVRFAFLFGVIDLMYAVDRHPRRRTRRVSPRARVVAGVAGFRGAVSLAAALAVPHALDSGAPFPHRDVIVFVTSGVVVVTVVAQGLLLPPVIRWARLPRDTAVEEELRLARETALREALAALPEVAGGLGSDPEVVERLRREYRTHLALIAAHDGDGDEEPAVRRDRHYTALGLALLRRKRATMIRLRDEGRIDDTVLRTLQTMLDAEEVRLLRHQSTD